MLYFGYGSNLCERDWGEWCSRQGEEASGLRFVRRAWLPEHELAFTFNSTGRGGGVLDVVERFGQAAPGALFEIDEPCRSALDKKEGAPSVYAPKEIIALDDEGGDADGGAAGDDEGGGVDGDGECAAVGGDAG